MQPLSGRIFRGLLTQYGDRYRQIVDESAGGEAIDFE